ncbi:MAG: glutamate---cysteine ligase / carboxylate-amine ligase, partial [Solirubrobacteraceae bacterium]|nr:glutamate---cysteine ligase / carboxylate-amine ligase [Solirubrobacteraceae bacterium]
MIDVAAARDLFEDSTDGTVGIEEEFALLDPQDHRLVPAFERLRDAGAADGILADAIAGELISSEIEIRSGRGDDYEDARRRQHEAR